VIADASFHRWRNSKALVYPAKIVIAEVKSASRFQVVELLGKRIRQPRESPDRHSHR